MMRTKFIDGVGVNPHPGRGQAILRAHPEARDLAGRNRWTAVLALALVGLQLGGAWLLVRFDVSWPWIVVLAATVGAQLVHALYAVVHETAHRLVFHARWGNRLVALLCNVPLVAPFTVLLSHYHLVHHRRQGQLGRDPDLPSAWERRWFAGGPGRKLLYMALFPLLQLFRPIHPDDRISWRDPWLVANVLVQLAAAVVITMALGAPALLYLLASVYCWGGPHPVLFARFVQEHFITTNDGHETHSYYGPLNHLTLNVGYHVEHHDLPGIPWHRLPALTRLAPTFYADRVKHRSWWRLGWQFIVDDDVQVASRVARDASGPSEFVSE